MAFFEEILEYSWSVLKPWLLSMLDKTTLSSNGVKEATKVPSSKNCLAFLTIFVDLPYFQFCQITPLKMMYIFLSGSLTRQGRKSHNSWKCSNITACSDTTLTKKSTNGGEKRSQGENGMFPSTRIKL